MTCPNPAPRWFTCHWRDWHRGHGCDLDDGRPRSPIATEEISQHTAKIDVRILTVHPHPDQATTHPGCWAVQFQATRAGESRTFWRWITLPGISTTPSNDGLLTRFWDDTFNELHGLHNLPALIPDK